MIKIGKAKDGELVAVIRTGGKLPWRVRGGDGGLYETQDEAVNEATKVLIRGWVEKVTEEELEAIVNGYVEVGYNFAKEWKEKEG